MSAPSNKRSLDSDNEVTRKRQTTLSVASSSSSVATPPVVVVVVNHCRALDKQVNYPGTFLSAMVGDAFDMLREFVARGLCEYPACKAPSQRWADLSPRVQNGGRYCCTECTRDWRTTSVTDLWTDMIVNPVWPVIQERVYRMLRTGACERCNRTMTLKGLHSNSERFRCRECFTHCSACGAICADNDDEQNYVLVRDVIDRRVCHHREHLCKSCAPPPPPSLVSEPRVLDAPPPCCVVCKEVVPWRKPALISDHTNEPVFAETYGSGYVHTGCVYYCDRCSAMESHYDVTLPDVVSEAGLELCQRCSETCASCAMSIYDESLAVVKDEEVYCCGNCD